MYYSNIKDSQHNWEKQNLVTLKDRKGHYDKMKCSNCGMEGKRYGFESIEVSERYKFENVHLCPKKQEVSIPRQIKIRYCNANGNQFKNLLPESIHNVVEPPQGYKNDHTGVWVMGVGEPVKVLSSEFSEVE